MTVVTQNAKDNPALMQKSIELTDAFIEKTVPESQRLDIPAVAEAGMSAAIPQPPVGL